MKDSSHNENKPLSLSLGAEEESNGFRVETEGGQFLGWVYPMDYIAGREGTWGAISDVHVPASDRSLYQEGFSDEESAATWLAQRWIQERDE